MANKSDIDLQVDLPGVTPVGLSINFTAGAIPVCTVDLAPAPPGTIKIQGGVSGVLSSPDSFKRRSPVNVTLSVKSHSGKGGATTRTLKWSGLFDGLSIGNTVGANSYQAVLKGKAQTLLELTTLTPGLTPTSINIYRNPFFAILGNAGSGDANGETAWSSLTFSKSLNLRRNPLEFYVDLLKTLLDKQYSDYTKYLGNETTSQSEKVIQKIFEEQRYKDALQKGKEILDSIDLSAVTSGSITQLHTSYPAASSKLREIFFGGPSSMLENLMNFLNFMGCTIVFGKDRAFVVPDKSFIKQEHGGAGVGESSNTPNRANPADYNGYIYNDSGYKDVMAVVLCNPMPVGGHAINNVQFDRGIAGYYKDEHELTKASGILVIPDHPFALYLAGGEANHNDAKELKATADNPSESYYATKTKYGGKATEEKQAVREQEKKQQQTSILADVVNNYAQTKFYQARYGDRRGTITMDFNPNWAPGASGTLFVRETSFYVDFYVESVTHSVDMSPPAGGTAVTVVNFCCGRMGSSPIGVDKDKFLGYDVGKEKGFISNFISDIGAS
jgi:hypothetical protein